METGLTREEALKALQTYNHEPFHLQHALTVEAVMGWFAKEEGFEAESDFWRMAGLLHDIDFEQWPEQHCVKCIELLQSAHATPELIHAVCCHGYGICTDVEPTLPMEKILFAADELTGLIWAAALIRSSQSTKDMELKSLKKKYKSKGFAAGCSREVIERGAAQLGWELEKLLTMTLQAMADCEDEIQAQMQEWGLE